MSRWYPLAGSSSDYAPYGWLDRYGSLSLTNLSPVQTFTEPITMAEACAFLRIAMPTDNTEEQIELQSFISGAREQAEIMQNKDLVQKQWDLTFDYWMSYRIALRTPLVSVDLVTYTDSDGVVHTLNQGPTADYIVDTNKQPGTISPPYNKTWPTFTPLPSSALLVRFTSGYLSTDPFWSDAGARIKVGMKLLISAWFNNRMPFELGSGSAGEYPFAVTSCLGYGAQVRAR